MEGQGSARYNTNAASDAHISTDDVAVKLLDNLPGDVMHSCATDAAKQLIKNEMRSYKPPRIFCSRKDFLANCKFGSLAECERKCYALRHSPRGRALVITMTAGRKGWQQDVKALHQMFLYLDMEAEYLYDLEGKELVKQLHQFAASLASIPFDCLFVVLMGHGGIRKNKEYLQTADNQAFYVRDALPILFNSNDHAHLTDKPKVFLVQMCRGRKADTGVKLIGDDSTNVQYPLFCDYIIGFASQQGYKSFRDEEEGAWYIQEMTEVIVKEASYKHIADMLTEVNSNLERREQVQVGEYTSSLKKLLYLPPKFLETEPEAPRRVRLQEPQLQLTQDRWNWKLGGVDGLLGLADGCIVGCQGRAVVLDSYGEKVGQYRAGDEGGAVWDMCVYDNNLFLIQDKSVTVHVMNEFDSPSASGGGRAAGGGQLGGRGRFYQVPGVEMLSGGVATGPDTLVLVDREKNEAVEWRLGSASTHRLISGLKVPYSICTQDQGSDVSYIVTSCGGHCVQVYTASSLLHTIGQQGQGDGQLWHPQDAALTEEGTVLVGDTRNARVCEFHQDGRYIRTLLTEQQLGGRPWRISLCPPYMWVNLYHPSKDDKILKYKLYSS